MFVGCGESGERQIRVIEAPKSGVDTSAIAASKESGEAKMTGADLYNNACASCHQKDGEGDPYRFPPLANSKVVSGNKEALIGIALNGLQGPIEAGGNRYDGIMPPHKYLGDEELSLILTYIRQNWRNHGDAISASEVNSVRSKIK